jgi:hypothetical protein
MAVLASAGFVMMPVYRALVLLGLNARIVEIVRSMKDIGKMTRRMSCHLPGPIRTAGAPASNAS